MLLVLLQCDIAGFREPGKWINASVPRSQWQALTESRNTTGDRFLARTKGAIQTNQFYVTFLKKGLPFSVGCTLLSTGTSF